MKTLIREAGFAPVQRDTRYRILRRFDANGSGDAEHGQQPVDGVA